jgi:release factor glutamine methyltransferase
VILTAAGIDEARINAEYLLARALAVPRANLRTDDRREVAQDEMAIYHHLLERRMAHEPLQYILGTTEFMGLELLVDRRALIPRPETEIVVEEALAALNGFRDETPRILDIGTGSGNIALSLAHFAPQAMVVAMDESQEALDLAALNAARLGIRRIRFEKADLFAEFLPGESFDLIVSNPPYVSAKDFEQLEPEIRWFEPRHATTDGADGLRFLRRIAELSARKLRAGGILIVELGFGQSEQAVEIAGRHGLERVAVRKDLAGIQRVLTASVTGS